MELAEKIEQIHMDSPDKGYRRINDELRHDHGIHVNDKRVLRICRARSIKSTIKYSSHGCTRQAKNPQYIAENLLDRKFYADRPNEVYEGVDRLSISGVRPAMWVDINQYLNLLSMSEPLETEGFPIVPTEVTCDESIMAETILGDTAWKMWLPEGFVADELTEADIADHYLL